MKYNYWFIDFFDDDGNTFIEYELDNELEQDSIFTINDVTYQVEYVEHQLSVTDEKWYAGMAIIRMIRYKLSDTSTSFVHKCPVKKSVMEKLDRDDVINLEKKFGKIGAKKRIEAWKIGRTKMRSYNKLELKCPLCECIFWKENNLVPQTVIVDGIMSKQGLKK